MMPRQSQEPTFLEFLLQKYPASLRWSKTRFITLEQAVCLSYGIEPPDAHKMPFLFLQWERFEAEVDTQCIYELSKNVLGSSLLPFYDRQDVRAEDFVKWAREHQLSIKEELFYRLEANENDESQVHARRNRPETMRKEVFRSIVPPECKMGGVEEFWFDFAALNGQNVKTEAFKHFKGLFTFRKMACNLLRGAILVKNEQVIK